MNLKAHYNYLQKWLIKSEADNQYLNSLDELYKKADGGYAVFHLLYTDKNKKFQNKHKEFNSFDDAEKYLEKIKAIYWEIGFPEKGGE